jgi:hypothetical protein
MVRMVPFPILESRSGMISQLDREMGSRRSDRFVELKINDNKEKE